MDGLSAAEFLRPRRRCRLWYGRPEPLPKVVTRRTIRHRLRALRDLGRLEHPRTHINRRNRRQRIIGWNEDIGGLIVAPRLCDHTLQLDNAVIRVDEGGAAGR